MKQAKKQKQMMLTILGISLILSTGTAYSQQADAIPNRSPASVGLQAHSSAEVALNNYYRDQASKQIEQILPKGKFGVQVNLKINTSKIKSDMDIEPIKLPLGDSFVTGSELKASGLVDQSLERLITYVDKVDVTVSIAPGISGQVQELITNSLKQMLLIDTKRGDSITYKDLPEAIINAWNPEPSIEIYKKPAMILSGYFGMILLFVALAVIFGFRAIGQRITREAGSLTGALKEVLETSPAFGGGMQNQPAMNQQASPVKMESSEPAGSQFWDKVDVDSITAFCFDCISQPIYVAIPSIMVGNILDPIKSSEVEKLLPEEFVVGFNGKTNLKNSDITQIFQKYQSEYRRANRSPMSKQILDLEIDRVVEFSKNLHKVELALLINAMTPMKRAMLLKSLTTEDKIELSKASQENLSAVEHKKHEVSLLEKIVELNGTRTKKEATHSLNYLASIILNVETFQEDESMYEKMASTGEYNGVLLAFDYFSNEQWEAFNLQDLAISFCGYSEKFKTELVGKFSGKKQDWMRNFLVKYEQNQPDFRSNQVESVHELIKSKVKALQEEKVQAGEEEQNAA